MRRKTERHGMSRSPEYNSWAGMLKRCYNPNNPSYKNYGGRGIKVCDRWRHSFINFYSDMGGRPSGLTLDRVDNDGNYEFSNCRWATDKEQNNNQRKRGISKNNTSGVTGVSWYNNQNIWRVHHKGRFVGSTKNFNEACKLRAEAEGD